MRVCVCLSESFSAERHLRVRASLYKTPAAYSCTSCIFTSYAFASYILASCTPPAHICLSYICLSCICTSYICASRTCEYTIKSRIILGLSFSHLACPYLSSRHLDLLHVLPSLLCATSSTVLILSSYSLEFSLLSITPK